MGNFKEICIAWIIFLFLINLVEMKSFQQHTPEQQYEHQEMLFAALTDPKIYNIRLRPYATKNTPITVYTSMFVYGMTSIDELRTEYSMQLLFRQTWEDERLKFKPESAVQKIVGSNWHAENIWTPSIHAVNDKEMASLASAKTEGTVYLHITPSGQVLLSKRCYYNIYLCYKPLTSGVNIVVFFNVQVVKLRPFCKMQFYRYPMDEQQCTLEIESSTLPLADLELDWAEDRPLDLNGNFLLTGFALTNYSLEQNVVSYRQTGNFSRITARFNLQREFGHFVLDIYIPSILFVVTSWLSFWVEIPAAPARVTLGMTTLLTLVTSEKAIRDKLPKVSYVHALDIWNVVCTGFVFASLVEYAVVNYIYNKDKRRRKKGTGLKRVESTATFCSVESEAASTFRMFAKKGELEPGMPSKKSASFASLSDMQSAQQPEQSSCVWPFNENKMTPQDIANSIDRKCRYIFPGGFLLFNVIYWLVLWL